MATDDAKKVAILKTTLDEQRRVYDWVSENFRHAGYRALTYAGGGLAVLTYLYTGTSSPATDSLFIPEATYGKIFYFIGVILVAFGLYSMLRAALPKAYELPTEQERLSELDKFASELEYLQYVNRRYTKCYASNIRACAERQKHLDTGFLPLVFGAIILVVIKVIGG